MSSDESDPAAAAEPAAPAESAPSAPPPEASPPGSTAWTVAAVVAGIAALIAVAIGVMVISSRGGPHLATGDTATPPAATFPEGPQVAVTDTVGHFGVVFPGEPTAHTQQVASAAGPLTYTTHQLATGATAGYSAGWVTYPASVDVSNPSTQLLSVMQSQVATTKGALVGSALPTTSNGAPALQFTVKVTGGYGKTLLVIKGHTMYTLQVFALDPAVPTFDPFVATFVITS